MTDKNGETSHDLPKTRSADHSGGVAGSAKQAKEDKVSTAPRDEGIRPEDLDTENDQGAS
ncbi:hypothetical protein [Aliirhizobium smilacinae]|uniref:Uncharacterized protein n=1 Tax=Aliirhizobium smilacinae TaxID=1395944 RepID=A0A5C4X8G3_9HYPH|nr:hypothetical protein [Rhizobium smilacinae]TNM59597.1 hypothetical protein FHP24_28185 [Rhizobium smilacinae]